MKRIVILISGRGSNLDAIARAAAAERWPAELVRVISSRADAPGLATAAAHGIPTGVVDVQAHADRGAFDAALGDAIDRARPDLVLLAGFMRILPSTLVQRYEGRLLNVHPSLLPAFPGLNTHRRAIEAGCTVAGATVHFVTPTLDHGPIVLQGVVPLQPDDDAGTLAARVLALEHRIYPMAARWAAQGRLRIDGSRVVQLDGEPQWIADTRETRG
jgi:phosphoribosylglycinamide formyltransferase-1